MDFYELLTNPNFESKLARLGEKRSMEITIRSDSGVCPVPNAYVGMQSCTPAMRW
jgi:hypothetical protein